jgi:hypothetical protein
MSCQISRRQCLRAALAGSAALAPLASSFQVSSAADLSRLAMPGPFRGRVVSVHSPSSIAAGKYNAEAVHRMVQKGMTALTGADDAAAAWKYFFERGDVVGIKLNPVGQSSRVVSSAETLREIIAGLNSAGIPNRDIIVYDRYHDQFAGAGFDKWLPEGVRGMWAVERYDPVQLAIEGYDPDHYMDMGLTLPGYDASNVTARRSYAALFITKHVNKVVNVPVLKDHQSAGVTLALKNLSHGLVNNVCRSHATNSSNACGVFIPAVVSMPVIRNKAVLNILDGVKGLYHGGPGGDPRHTWEHKTMYFSTDPVAMDHVGWEVIDRQRVQMKMAPVMTSRADKYALFVNRQPEHIEFAGAMGLGEWDLARIKKLEFTVA